MPIPLIPLVPTGLLPSRDLSPPENRKREVRIFLTLTLFGLAGVFVFFSHAPAATGLECAPVSLRWMFSNGVTDPATIERMMRCAREFQQEHKEFLLYGYIVTYITFHAFAI